MKLWVDDIREAPAGWIWVKTVEDATEYLMLYVVEEVSIDHDLGEGEQTGYDLVTWVERTVVKTNYIPPRMTIHSANPVGRKNMEAGLRKIRELIAERR